MPEGDTLIAVSCYGVEKAASNYNPMGRCVRAQPAASPISMSCSTWRPGGSLLRSNGTYVRQDK
jgi:hypothetical protein